MPGTLELWTDGSSTGGVGDGGWAYVLRYQKADEEWVEREHSGYDEHTTNQRMEMTALLMGLRALKREGVVVMVYTDSKYVMDCFVQKWYVKWRKNDWRAGTKGNYRPVINQDIWEALLEEYEKHTVRFTHVKGHAKGEFPINERCDELAVAAKKAGMDKYVPVELPEVPGVAMELA